MKALGYFFIYVFFCFQLNDLTFVKSLSDSAENTCIAYYNNLTDEFSDLTHCVAHNSRPFRACQVSLK